MARPSAVTIHNDRHMTWEIGFRMKLIVGGHRKISEFHEFRFFFCQHRIHGSDMFVGHRLNGIASTPLVVFAAHAPAPWSAERGESFTLLIDAIVKETKAGRRVALVGDLNAAPFGSVFARLKTDGGLRDPRRGRRPIATWPIPVFGPGLQIDHILVGPDVAVIDHQIGAMLRSDHTLIWADLRW